MKPVRYLCVVLAFCLFSGFTLWKKPNVPIDEGPAIASPLSVKDALVTITIPDVDGLLDASGPVISSLFPTMSPQLIRMMAGSRIGDPQLAGFAPGKGLAFVVMDESVRFAVAEVVPSQIPVYMENLKAKGMLAKEKDGFLLIGNTAMQLRNAERISSEVWAALLSANREPAIRVALRPADLISGNETKISAGLQKMLSRLQRASGSNDIAGIGKVLDAEFRLLLSIGSQIDSLEIAVCPVDDSLQVSEVIEPVAGSRLAAFFNEPAVKGFNPQLSSGTLPKGAVRLEARLRNPDALNTLLTGELAALSQTAGLRAEQVDACSSYMKRWLSALGGTVCESVFTLDDGKLAVGYLADLNDESATLALLRNTPADMDATGLPDLYRQIGIPLTVEFKENARVYDGIKIHQLNMKFSTENLPVEQQDLLKAMQGDMTFDLAIYKKTLLCVTGGDGLEEMIDRLKNSGTPPAPLAARGAFPSGGTYYADVDVGAYLSLVNAIAKTTEASGSLQKMADVLAGADPVVLSGFCNNGRMKACVKVSSGLLARLAQAGQVLAMEAAQKRTERVSERRKPKTEISQETPVTPKYTGKPLPSGADAKVWKDFQQLNAAVLARELISTLDACPVKGTVTKAELTEFLTHLTQDISKNIEARQRSWRFPLYTPNHDAMLEQLDQWFAQGVDHPSLRYAHVILQREAGNRRSKMAQSQAGLKLMDESGLDSPWMRFEFLEEVARWSEPASERGQWRARALEMFPAAFHATLFNSGEERMMSFRLMNKLGSYFNDSERRRVADALAADDQVPAFITQLADGATHIEEAWDARGSGYANTVTEEGWKGFKTHLDAARAALTASWEAQPGLPEAATEMITVAKGRSIERNETRKWFDRAVAAQFDYAEAYWGLYDALMPRWCGSIDQMLSLGQECIDTGRFDTKVPLQYFYILMDASKEYDYESDIYQRSDVLENLERILDGYRERGNLDEFKMQGVASFVAAAAVRGGNYTLAYRALKDIGFQINRAYAEDRLGTLWEDYVVSAFLRGGPVSEEYNGLLKMIEDKDFDGADRAYAHLLDTPDLINRVYDRLQLDRAALKINQVPQGKWVDVFGRGESVPWAGERCHWKLDDAGRLMAADEICVGWLPGQISISDGFEIEFTVDHSAGEFKPNEQAVLVLARPEWHQYFPIRVTFDLDGKEVSIKCGMDHDNYKSAPCQFNKSNAIQVAVRDQLMMIKVNGTDILSDYKLPDSGRYTQPMYFGLGDFYRGSFKDQLRFHSIRVKQGMAD